MYRSLFKKNAAQNLAEMADLTLGRAFSIDPIELKLIGKDALFVPPETDLRIVAQGLSDLGEQSFLHRFYPDDDRFILQIQGGDGESDTRIDEIVLWYAFDVQYLSRDIDWQNARRAMRKSRFDLPCEGGAVKFERVWFDHSDEDEEPMTYFETVRDRRDAEGDEIYQSAMLFGRALDDGSDEMLLINTEEPDKGERAVSYLIGRAIPAHSLLS